ncbi:MAG: NnrS family protein [Proteobacteria bacterium]|nr:NnrS family protein [Pseudomonadota bacterium]
MKTVQPILLSFAFRPLFLVTGIFGVVSIGWWTVIYLLGIAFPPTGMDPVSWHSHEMIYGFACAGIGGFLLTAVASWTKRPPVAGYTLGLLVFALLSITGAVVVAILHLVRICRWRGLAAYTNALIDPSCRIHLGSR